MTVIFALGDNAGFILGSYALSFAVIGGYTWRIMRAGRRLADRVDDEQKYWT